MKCPYCGNFESKVIDSRGMGEGIRRRRQCFECNTRFTTYERLQPKSFFVVKKDSRREEFNRDKLLSGIRKACEKRPLPTGAIDKLVDSIEFELYRLGKNEVTSFVVGDVVMEKLKELDHIAYIRFGSVYREFTDLSTLKKEVDTLVKTKGEASPDAQLSLLSDDVLENLGHRQRRQK